MTTINIMEEKFRDYLYCQVEGIVNMNLHSKVSQLTGLSIDEIKNIQENYQNYLQKFSGLRDEIEEEFMENLR